MLERTLPLLLLFVLPAVAWCQNPLRPPKSADAAEELKRLIAARDALTTEIAQLRKATGLQQQVIVSVQVCELSLTKARNAEIDVPGFDAKWPPTYRFEDVLSARQAKELGQPSAAERDRINSMTRTLDSDVALKKLIADLKHAGAWKVLAEPTVTTLDGRPASLHVGGEFPILVAQKDGNTATQFRPYGTQLSVTPVVLGEGKLKLDLHPELSELDPSLNVTTGNVTVPGVRTRGLRTAIEMNAGETYLFSGFVQMGKSQTAPGEMEEIELIMIVRAEIVDSL
ncbi:hypothetical protein LOC68_10090 [Blastopirellula sp. JC732]|uniref:Type II/III secretion system secretin-like domain-containing protein n=1 Tax=Blastopirellula sediminis TaxID=2894196 RepID=A0A9X1ML96_9BACT|nr:hypothetical protein [Blastopirellula sediminis]MCC9608474.1 hypothetical protein [Blastopirellula sediminis]MCC9628749.1 hypothetical protein [Blastopirellula sediminis]